MALVLLAVIGFTAYRSTMAVVSGAADQQRADEVVATLDAVGRELVDAETGERGYVVTGDPAFLQPLRAATANLPGEMAHLEAELKGDPAQERRAQRLRPVMERKLRWVEHVVDVRDTKGVAVARDVVASGHGKATMDAMRHMLDEMQHEEVQAAGLAHPGGTEVRAALASIAGGSGLAFVVGALALLLLRADSRRRLRDEQVLRLQSQIVDQVHDAVIATDVDGVVQSWNQGAERITGYTRAEALERPVSFLYPEEERDMHERDVIAPLQAKGAHEVSVRLRKKSGEDFYGHVSLSLLRDDDGEPIGMIGYTMDVTDQRRAEDALRVRAEQQSRVAALGERALACASLPELLRDAVSVVTEALDVELCELLELLPGQGGLLLREGAGWQEGLVGRTTVDAGAASQAGYTLERGGPVVVADLGREARFTAPLLTAHQAVSGITVVIQGHKRAFGVLGAHARGRREFTADDVALAQSVANIVGQFAERTHVLERLREQAALLEHAHDAIVVVDMLDRVTFWNRAAERITGWRAEETIGRDLQTCLYSADVERYRRARRKMLEDGEWAGELRARSRDHKPIVSQVSWTLFHDEAGRPQGVLAIMTDVTEQRLLEAQFYRAQRLESIGTLASGMAHDLNNILQPVMLSGQLLQKRRPGQDTRPLVDMIVRNCRRGAELIRQVLSFARGAESERAPLDPATVIDEVAPMLRRTLPPSITLEVDRPQAVRAVAGNATQLHQVLMNLCVNARDAMHGAGVLHIDVADAELSEADARRQLDARAGWYVRIRVVDTGVGIAPDLIDKIFDPFVTTKGQGEGTGLGLSTVRGIVVGHGGFIAVDSEPGRGTTFSVYLPALDEASQPAPAGASAAALPGHGERILVIDDEAEVREATRDVLESAGYRVVTAEDGVNGVQVFRSDAVGFQAVVTDMVMPRMSGAVTIERLREVDPHVRVIVTSGVLERSEAAAYGAVAFVPKPVELDTLLEVVADTLARPA